MRGSVLLDTQSLFLRAKSRYQLHVYIHRYIHLISFSCILFHHYRAAVWMGKHVNWNLFRKALNSFIYFYTLLWNRERLNSLFRLTRRLKRLVRGRGRAQNHWSARI